VNEINGFVGSGRPDQASSKGVASATYNCALESRSFGTAGIIHESIALGDCRIHSSAFRTPV